MTDATPRRPIGALAGVILACLLLVPTAPAGAATVSVPASTTIDGVGATAQVPLAIDDATGVEGVDLRLTFDAAVVQPGAVDGSALGTDCAVVANPMTGEVRIGVACTGALSGAPTLVTIDFQGVSAGSSPLTIDRCDLNEGAIACTPISGTLVVSSPTPTATSTATATRTATATATATRTATSTGTATHTATATPTRTPTRTQTATRTVTNTATPTPVPTVRLDPIAAPIVVGAAHTLTGTGFTAGSVVLVFVATSSGAVNQGPFTPTSRTATSLTWAVPASMPLGNGFATVIVVNTDQGYIQSNPQSQLLQGSAAANIPTILSVNGVAVHTVDATVPLAYVETVLTPGAAVTIGGTGFNGPLVNLFTAAGNLGPLAPLPGGSPTAFQVTVPANAPTGPGSFQVVNNPYTGNVVSNAVSVPIGALLSITAVTQSGTTVTVDGTGFSTLSVINFFAQKSGGGVDNFGGLGAGGQPKIPLAVQSPTRFSFTVPAGTTTGPAYVMVLNPPYIPYSSSGSDPDGAFTLTVP